MELADSIRKGRKMKQEKLTNIQKQLFEMQDLEYREFHSKLMPTIDKETVIGVRVPRLRAFAKDIVRELKREHKDTDERCKKKAENSNVVADENFETNATIGEIETFMRTLPHQYYEENNLHAFLLEAIVDYDDCISALDDFLPHVDNWATCDSMKPKVFKKNKDRLLIDVERWLTSEHTYEVRFAINMLMTHFLDEEFKPEYLDKVASVKSDEYYINMMIAWYFATALAKQYEETIVYLEERRLPEWIHKKTIQKAIESHRISTETKQYLRQLK